MTPGFMYGATKYQTQSNKGVRYNYWFEDASLCRKDLSLSSAKTTTFKNSLFLPIIGDMTNELLKVLFMCEIQSISGFSGRKRLHVEYRILYDTEIWNCKGVHPLQISSSSEGATQSQKPKTRNMLLFWKEKMCYFAHPVEALLETDEDPGVTRWPSLLFKVCSSDLRGNEVCKGYAWISLHDICPGNKETTLKTWKPQSTGFKKVIQLFKGETTELNSIENVGIPMCPGSVLIKYGLQTTSSGSIQIRTNCFVQNNDKELQTHPQKQNVVLPFKDPGLISILRRAKFRLEQSGEGQRLPPDLLETKTEKSVHCPVITKQPDGDLRVKEGHSFIIEVQAKGTDVLHYQWYKDSEKISSNAQSPIYKVHNSCKKDRGIYTCKVSNKGGACQSAPCTVHIMTKRNTTTQGL